MDGEPVPGTFAAEDELFGIGQALASLGTGVFELAPAGVMGEDILAPEREVAWMRRLSSEIRRPVSFALLQVNSAPDQWRDLLRLAAEANADGADLRPQVAGRALNILMGFQTIHPFSNRPSYAAIADLPLAERASAPGHRRGAPGDPVRGTEYSPIMKMIVGDGTTRMFPLGEPPNYEPTPAMSVAAIAARDGRPTEEVLYDLMLRHDGRELLLFTLSATATAASTT